MRAALALSIALALAGCGYDMTPELFEAASQMCASHGGLAGAKKREPGLGSHAFIYADCRDGSRVEKRIQLRPIK